MAVVADAQAAVRAPQAVPEAGDVSLYTTLIQDIRVGQRVQAHNPEVSAKERESWDEPDWSQWQLVRLEMPKPDGCLLEIEMLRPQEWLDSQAALVVETREVIAHPGPLDVQEASAESQESGPSVTSPNQFSESGTCMFPINTNSSTRPASSPTRTASAAGTTRSSTRMSTSWKVRKFWTWPCITDAGQQRPYWAEKPPMSPVSNLAQCWSKQPPEPRQN